MTAPRDTGSEPRTEAGRRLLTNLDLRGTEGVRVGRMILAIEAEAARTDDARLARVVEALSGVIDHSMPSHASYCASQPDDADCICETGPIMDRAYALLALPVPDRPAEPVLDVTRLGLSDEQTAILRKHLASRAQTLSAFLGDVLMELGLGRATGKEYPPASYAVAEAPDGR